MFPYSDNGLYHIVLHTLGLNILFAYSADYNLNFLLAYFINSTELAK